MGAVLVFGHTHPDNDSVCSAVGYAHLKNLTDPDNVYVPVRLGPVPRETEWVFSRFGVEIPEQIGHVHTRVQDVMTADVTTIDASETMLAAGRLMRDLQVRALPVLEDGVVHGLVNVDTLASRYIDEIGLGGFEGRPVEVGMLAQVLDAEILAGDPSATLGGALLIGAMEPETMVTYIKPGDTLIVGDRVRTQPMALEAGVACLIITGGKLPDADVVALAHERGAAVMVTAYDTYSAARLAAMSYRVGDLMETNVLLVEPEMLLGEATEDLLASPHRDAIVVDKSGHPAGILTRTNIARGIRRKVVLVDHNEAAQSAPGIEDASVVEIVDHHRVGDIQTTGPILFLNMPVGSTATIVATRYEELGVPVPASVAGLLLSAVLTDTVLLKSPTTTDTDRMIAGRLSSIAGVDPQEFGMEIFRSRSTGEVFSAERVVTSDVKEYRIGDVVASVAQFETVSLAEVMDHADELLVAMESLRERRGHDLVILMVTDIVREGSEIMAVGKVRLAERALGISLAGGSAWLDGVLSRKKQVAAHLAEAAGV
jgi:manganese-dependent inorganic pyrophosphatase